MTFLEFQRTFSAFPVISVVEIGKAFPGFDRNALTRWQRKGYIEKIRSGYYRLAKPVAGEGELFFAANRIYAPSYVSLQSALSWYGFIPEGVFTVTSVSTLKTQSFETPLGHFSYRSVRKDLFFGYRMETFGDIRAKVAHPEKALLDFLYLTPHLCDADHFHELRLNFWEIQSQCNLKRLETYLKLFDSGALSARADKFIQFLKEHAVFS